MAASTDDSAATARPHAERARPVAPHRVAGATEVAAPAEAVWQALSDPAGWADWVEGTLEVHDAPPAIGLDATYGERNRVLGPWKARTRWRVVEWVPPRRQRHSGTGIPLLRDLTVCFEVAPTDSGHSRFTMSFDYEPAGIVGRLACALLLRRRLCQSVDRSLRDAGRLAGGATR